MTRARPAAAWLLAAALPAAGLPAAEPLPADSSSAAPSHVHAAIGHDHFALGDVPADSPQPVLGDSTYTAADLLFLSHMIVHHQQALDLCDLVPARSDRAEFQRFARYLHDAQRNEIALMQGLLQQAAKRGATVSPPLLDGDPPMEGMLARAQMAAIGASQGSAFERLWLQGMIHHHQGGVDMALAQQVAQYANGNQPWGVDVLVDDMLTVQRAEITRMTAWLDAWR